MITKDEKAKRVKDFARAAKDTGSSEVQIALLTDRIKNLTEHANRHPKDAHSRRGLSLLVSQRNKLLKYLARVDEKRYVDLLGKLNLRK